MGKPIQDSLAIAKDAQTKINALLQGPETIYNLVTINEHFKKIIYRLEFMGIQIEPTKQAATQSQFPPITNFMGETIIRGKDRTTEEELNPDEEKRRIFKAKVQTLYNRIESFGASQILSSYVMPGDIAVLRAVAKWAGVKDFKQRKITQAFVEDIILNIKIKNEETEKQLDIDEMLNEETETILTKEDIDGDPELQKWKAKAGDILITTNDGKRKIKKPKAPVTE